MGMFGNIIIFLFAVNILFGVFGIVSPSDSLISSMVTGDIGTSFLWDYVKERLNPLNADAMGITAIFGAIGLLAAGLVSKRDDLIYAPLMVGLLVFLGIFNAFKIIPMFGNLIYVGMILLTTWSGIEWLRGMQ
jgi:hypothetical protein